MSNKNFPNAVYIDDSKFMVFSSEDGNPNNAQLRSIGCQESAVVYFDGEDD